MEAVVLCGGMSTRLGGGVPKVLREVAGQPFIFHKLENMRAQGITSATLLVGTHRQAFLNVLTTTRGWKPPKRRGIVLDIVSDPLMGTGGALVHASPVLPERFWLSYGDSLLGIPCPSFQAALRGSSEACMIVTPPAEHLPPPNVRVAAGYVRSYQHPVTFDTATHVDYGMIAMDRRLVLRWPYRAASRWVPFGLDGLLRQPIQEGQVLAMPTQADLLHINTPADLARTEAVLNADLRRWPAAGLVPGAGRPGS